MKQLLCAVIILSVMFAACACTETAAPAVPEITDEDLYAVDVPEEHWPVIEGSAAFLPYYTAAAARMLEVSEDEASRYVCCTVTDFAYSDLVFGSADLIFAFLPTQQQAMLADAEGVTLACYPVMNEAFVFFVSPDNPVDSLTLQQLKEIYTGAVTDWSDLGGNEGAILPFRRSEGSSDYIGLTRFIAQGSELIPVPTRLRSGSMGETAEVPANYDGSANAIGCGYLHNVRQQYAGMDLKILKIDGIEASGENICSGAYPLISQACAVIRGGEEDSPAGQLAQWCAWPLGQTLAAEKGYVPNMELEEKEQSGPDEEPALPSASAEPEGGWAEGKAVPAGSTDPLQKNGLRLELSILSDTETLYADCLTVSGLKDKTVETAVNQRIRETVDFFCADDYLPDAQGMQIALDRGMKSENVSYKYIHTQMTANSNNVLSVVVTCRSAYDLPHGGAAQKAGAFFTACIPLNLDLKTGKNIPITAFIADSTDALICLDGLTQQYLYENADDVYRDEGYVGRTEGIAETELLITDFPGLDEDQKYYVDGTERALVLVLDVRTPWAVTGNDFSCLPLDPGVHAAFGRFVTEEDLFE